MSSIIFFSRKVFYCISNVSPWRNNAKGIYYIVSPSSNYIISHLCLFVKCNLFTWVIFLGKYLEKPIGRTFHEKIGI